MALHDQPARAFVYRDRGSLISLSNYSSLGMLMGGLQGGSFFVEGWLARMMYISLYRLHQVVLHGWPRALSLALGGHFRKLSAAVAQASLLGGHPGPLFHRISLDREPVNLLPVLDLGPCEALGLVFSHYEQENNSMSMQILKAAIISIAAGATSLAYAQQEAQQGSGEGNAQQSAPQQAGQKGGPKLDLSDSEVEKFAQAQNKVQSVREDYSGQLRNVEDTEKAREIQAEMQEKMLQAVKDAGMSAQKYNEVSQAAMQDEELRKRIEGAMK
jgi:hypothetical protein